MTRKSITIFFSISLLLTFTLMQVVKSSNWRLAYEQQAYLRCLPYELSLINKTPPDQLVKGDLVVVSTEQYQEFYRDGVELLKLIMGTPGDKVLISDSSVSINGEVIAFVDGSNSPFPAAFEGEYTLLADQYWIGGVSNVSIDSRYIGPVSKSTFIGTAYALF